VNSLSTKFCDNCQRTVHPVRRKRVPTPSTPGGVALHPGGGCPPPRGWLPSTPGGVAGLAARYSRRSADSVPVAHCCACGGGGGWALQERSEPGLHPRLRGDVLFPLLVRESGACLLSQGQKAARACQLRRRPERVKPVERRQAAKTACSLPTHRPRVGATFLCASTRWCPSSYFLPYSTQIWYWGPHPFSVSSRTCKNLSELHRALNHALISSPPRHNECLERDTSKHSQRASRSPFSTSVYEQFESEPGSWWIQQRGALRWRLCGRHETKSMIQYRCAISPFCDGGWQRASLSVRHFAIFLAIAPSPSPNLHRIHT